MKAKLVDRGNPLNQSFSSSYLDEKNFFKVWHYHPELELVIILESKGTRFVGDSIYSRYQVLRTDKIFKFCW